MVGNLLFVVFTFRKNIRLIFARLATESERGFTMIKIFIIKNDQVPTQE